MRAAEAAAAVPPCEREFSFRLINAVRQKSRAEGWLLCFPD
jgi:hypothetical protein